MKVEFECIVCGTTDEATVADEAVADAERPMETLNRCEQCSQETIWLEVGRPDD